MTRVERHAGRALDAPRARGVLADLAIGLALALGAVSATWRLLALPASYLLVGLALHGALTALIVWRLPAGLPGPGIGIANRITLGRAALAMPVLALSLHPGQLGAGARWWIIALSTVVLLLDGVDGLVARRTGSQSRFGARFDMELDAALLLALSLLVWRSDIVGAWVLLIGLMRYLFVGAGRLVPAFAAELPPSHRRRLVCVVQGVVLLVALGPIIPQPVAVAVTLTGLAALTYSFAVDMRWALTA